MPTRLAKFNNKYLLGNIENIGIRLIEYYHTNMYKTWTEESKGLNTHILVNRTKNQCVI